MINLIKLYQTCYSISIYLYYICKIQCLCVYVYVCMLVCVCVCLCVWFRFNMNITQGRFMCQGPNKTKRGFTVEHISSNWEILDALMNIHLSKNELSHKFYLLFRGLYTINHVRCDFPSYLKTGLHLVKLRRFLS